MKWLVAALVLTVSTKAAAQVNLVLNPDFEQYVQCPDGLNRVFVLRSWTGIDSSLHHPCDVLDYCNSCSNPNSGVYVPSGGFYYQYPHSGDGFMLLTLYCDSSDYKNTDLQRQYLQGRLSKKLEASKRYCISFWVNLCETSRYAVKELSAYFDNGTIDTATMCGLPQTQVSPQFTYSGPIITDTMSWVKVEGSFTANGTEKFITIGNFKDKAHSTVVTIPGNGWNANVAHAFYLVDDVSVVESSTKANAGPDTHVGQGDSVFIGLPDKALDCYWTKLGSSTVIGTGAGIWVKPTVATSYVVTMMLCGAVTKDTVNVQVWKLGVNNPNIETQTYTLAPNPNDGNLSLRQAVNDAQPVSVKIYNGIGGLVYSANRTFEANAASLNLRKIAPGTYFVVLQESTGKIYTLTFVKK